MTNPFESWMWSDACRLLALVEEHRRRFSEPRAGEHAAVWEPPVDVLEFAQEVVIIAAFPGVNPEGIETVIEGDILLLAGQRQLPRQFASAVIHRLELPQGRFVRRVPLPRGRYRKAGNYAIHGCLVVTLSKLEAGHE